MQMKSTESPGGSEGTPTTIQLEIHQMPSGVGKDKTYDGSGGNTVKVKYQKNNYAGTNFEFYIHTLASGGEFTLNKTIKNGDNNTATLQGEVNDISNVSEVYYYKNGNKGALKIKMMGNVKIFHKADITQTGGQWTNQATTSPADSDLKALVNYLNRQGTIGELYDVPAHWSPVLMLSFSLGTVYAFYPSISPYSLVDDPFDGKTIELWIQFISTLPTYLIAVMDTLDNGDTLKGPGGIGPGNWGEFVNKDGTDVKETMRMQLKTLDSHMKAKVNYQKQNESNTINYTASDQKFGKKVNDARKKVDPTVTNPDPVQNSTELKNALNTGGQIKQVITDWETIQNIGGQDKTNPSNKLAKEAIAEIKKCTSGPTHSTIGDHTTSDKPANSKNWNIHGHRKFWHYQWLFAIPYILCIHVFISTLHFPDGWIGRRVKNNIIVAGIVGNIFNVVQEWLEAIGFSGGGKQGDEFNGAVSQYNGLSFLTTCMITMFTED